jgi:hypothetical protein
MKVVRCLISSQAMPRHGKLCSSMTRTPSAFLKVRSRTDAQLTGLVALMRSESAADHFGGRAILSALSTAMFALVLRLASEADDAPVGLLALAGHPPSGPGADGAIQRTGGGLVAAGARPSLQHVARDAGAPVPGEARRVIS